MYPVAVEESAEFLFDVVTSLVGETRAARRLLRSEALLVDVFLEPLLVCLISHFRRLNIADDQCSSYFLPPY
jgi:hypothetical protein